MSGIIDDDVDAMIAVCVPCGSWRGGMRAAAEEIERRVLERVNAEARPMHEPVSDDEAKAMIDAIHYGKADSWFERVRSAGNELLAGRAAATRAEVVVTADAVDRAGRRIFGSTWLRVSKAAEDVRAALDEFVTGEPEKPFDPRVKFVQTRLKMTREVAEDFLALLDEVKP